MFACAQWRKQDQADLVSRSVCLFLLFSENHPLVLFTIWNHVWWDLSNQPPFICTGSHLQSSCCAAYLRFPSPCIYFCVHKVLIAIRTWLHIYNKTFFSVLQRKYLLHEKHPLSPHFPWVGPLKGVAMQKNLSPLRLMRLRWPHEFQLHLSCAVSS